MEFSKLEVLLMCWTVGMIGTIILVSLVVLIAKKCEEGSKPMKLEGFDGRLARALERDEGKVWRVYSLDGDRKMYFTGTQWGAPGYFNQESGAHPFLVRSDAEIVKEWLDNNLVVPREHHIEEVE